MVNLILPFLFFSSNLIGIAIGRCVTDAKNAIGKGLLQNDYIPPDYSSDFPIVNFYVNFNLKKDNLKI